jgi:hypothetical protein
LFDPDSRTQTESLLELVPTGETVDPVTGAIVPETRSKAEILGEIEAEREFLDGAELCKR